MVELEIEGPAIRWQTLSALTRPGPPIDIVDLYRKKDPWIARFQGASFDLTLAPSRPYEGVIRDRESGAPIPGVVIESYRLADSNIINDTLVKTKSDNDRPLSPARHAPGCRQRGRAHPSRRPAVPPFPVQAAQFQLR